MIKLFYKPVLFLFLVFIQAVSFAQPFSVEVIIKNQPDNKISFGAVRGDDFIERGIAFAENGIVRFRFREGAETGVYRIVLGKTKYAEVMNEEPQQLDFIFNGENIVLETNFKAPETETNVIQSAENEVWFLFKTKERVIQTELKELTQEVDYYWETNKKEKAIKAADELNRLQIEHDLFITQWVKNADTLFAAKLIATYRLPMLDGYLTKEQRNELFKREYLKAIDFSDESLLNSQAYTDRVFNYLVSYNKKGMTSAEREKAYEKAVDEIVANVNKNQTVYKFIMNYIKHGFKVLKLDSVIAYINEKYPTE